MKLSDRYDEFQENVCVSENPNVERKKNSHIRNFVNKLFVRKKRFVIDASIASEEKEWKKLIKEAQETGTKIILTSLTIRELQRLQKHTNYDGTAARHLLATAVKDSETFVTVTIDENMPVPDDCIIRYCTKNKRSVILVTSDKEMALLAREKVETRYIPHEVRKQDKNKSEVVLAKSSENHRIEEKFVLEKVDAPVKLQDGKMFAVTPKESRSLLRVKTESKDYEFADVQEVHINDDIYMAMALNGEILFEHYKIISYTETGNAALIFSQSILPENIRKINNVDYRIFVKEFLKKFDALVFI